MKRLEVHSPKSLLMLFFKVGGGQVLIFVMWVVMFGWFSEVALTSARQFAEDGIDTSALVADKYTERKRSSSGNSKRRYFLDLEYEILSGEEISKRQPVQISEYNRVEEGEIIEITYLHSNPQKIEVTKGRNFGMGRSVRTLAWLSAFAVLVGTWIYGGRALDAFRARKHGQREEVKLIEVRKSGWWLFGKGYRLIWREKTGHEGKSLKQNADKLMGFRPGDTLVVFRGDKRSWWAGDVGERVDA